MATKIAPTSARLADAVEASRRPGPGVSDADARRAETPAAVELARRVRAGEQLRLLPTQIGGPRRPVRIRGAARRDDLVEVVTVDGASRSYATTDGVLVVADGERRELAFVAPQRLRPLVEAGVRVTLPPPEDRPHAPGHVVAVDRWDNTGAAHLLVEHGGDRTAAVRSDDAIEVGLPAER